MTYRISIIKLSDDIQRVDWDPERPYRLIVETLDNLGLSNDADRIIADLMTPEALAVKASGIVDRCTPVLPDAAGIPAPTELVIREAKTEDPIVRWDLALRIGEDRSRVLARLDGANARLLSEASGGKVALPEAMLREMEEMRRAFDTPAEVTAEDTTTPSL